MSESKVKKPAVKRETVKKSTKKGNTNRPNLISVPVMGITSGKEIRQCERAFDLLYGEGHSLSIHKDSPAIEYWDGEKWDKLQEGITNEVVKTGNPHFNIIIDKKTIVCRFTPEQIFLISK